jgi:hypothetical protein
MANTYTWLITKLQCLPTLEGKTDVVCSIGFSISATDSVNTALVTNNLMLSYDANQSFVNYDNLTSDTVLGWVQSALGADGISKIQSELDVLVSNLSNPPVITRSLPWAD